MMVSTLPSADSFIAEIEEIIRANGWEGQLIVEALGGNPTDSDSRQTVRIKLSSQHSVAPLEIVNEYTDGVHPLEQVQQECLRALRTGYPGI
jgi:hypothetical protein